MQELRESIRQTSDRQLLDRYVHHKGEYTPEALEVMQEEINRRGIDESLLDAASPAGETSPEAAEGTVSLRSEDFLKFDHSFSRTDLLLASAMLRERQIPFFVDNPTSSDILPTEGEAEKRFFINIPKTFEETAHTLLDEHFVKSDNKYLLKYTGARERLRAFNFHDIHLTESESLEELEVALSPEEKTVIVALGRRLLGEAEKVEQAQERVLFYYDSIEPLIEQLEAPDISSLSKNDLLAVLEIFQVYIDDSALPATMDETISQLLTLFIGS